MHVSDDTNDEEFKDLFLGHYWDQSRQGEIRYQMMNGKYDSRKHGAMAEYFSHGAASPFPRSGSTHGRIYRANGEPLPLDV